MKKILLLVCFLFAFSFCFFNNNSSKICKANFIAEYENQKFILDDSGVSTNIEIRKNIYNLSLSEKYDIVNKIISMGFSLIDAINYVFPNLNNSIKNIENKVNQKEIDASVYSLKNCKIGYKNGKSGLKIDKNDIYLQFYENLRINQTIKINANILPVKIGIEDLKNKYFEMGKFSTNFSSSSLERKNNIKTALSSIDGVIIKNGEIFSFNNATGIRDEKNGYKQAKIIIDGSYVDGFGGGVCQVSTTLYNAALLAGLDIIEVHNHTLPSHYVEPCFDAMVNFNSADLKIKNNTGGDCIITTSYENDKCKIVIYGLTPKFKIVRRSEKYETIKPGITYKNINEENAVNKNGVEGYKARGYLDYYQSDKLVKTKLIRNDTYKAIDEVVVV